MNIDEGVGASMKVLIVRYDDWAEMFLDGVSVVEGHSIRPEEALRKCGIEVTTREPTNAEIIEKVGYDPAEDDE